MTTGPNRIITGEFTLESKDGAVRWTTVTESVANDPQKARVPQSFSQGLSYARADRQKVFSKEFMQVFPQNAEKERNLVFNSPDETRITRKFEYTTR